jgi:hypothetical protein
MDRFNPSRPPGRWKDRVPEPSGSGLPVVTPTQSEDDDFLQEEDAFWPDFGSGIIPEDILTPLTALLIPEDILTPFTIGCHAPFYLSPRLGDAMPLLDGEFPDHALFLADEVFAPLD